MSDLPDVLATIDGALADYSMSADAMRWTTEPQAEAESMLVEASRVDLVLQAWQIEVLTRLALARHYDRVFLRVAP